MRFLQVFLLSSISAFGQVIIAGSPQPLAVMDALKTKMPIGMWTLFIKYDGPVVRTISPEEIYIALIDIKPIDPQNAITVLSGKQASSTASKIVRVLTVAGQGTGIALGFLSKSNIGWAVGLGLGSAAIPQIITIASGQVPSTAPYVVSLLNTPITLASGQAVTRTIFCAKQPTPHPIIVRLP